MNQNRSPNHLDITGLDQPDPLDDLLLKSAMPEPGPWFAAETLARCRVEKKSARAHRFPRLAFSLLGLAAVGCLLLVGFGALPQEGKVAVVAKPIQNKPVTDAFLVVASIDSSLEEECDDSTPL